MIRSPRLSFARHFLVVSALVGLARTAYAGAGPGDASSAVAPCTAELATDLAPFAGTVVVHEEDGRVHPVEDLRIGEFVAGWPAFAAKASAAGLGHADQVKVARALLKKFSHAMIDPAHKLEHVTAALAAAVDRGLNLRPALPRLLKLIEGMERYDLTARAFSNLVFALRAGLDVAEACTLFTTIAERRGYLGAYTLDHLRDLLKTIEEYAVPPTVAFATLSAVLTAPDFEDGRLARLADLIKRDVLVHGSSADRSLRDARVPGFAARVDARLSAKPRGPRPYFAKITGRLRHAEYPYVVERTYADGLNDLRTLALDETCATEGAFVFSPAQNAWYSLGGSTDVTVEAVRHEFVAPDWSQFGRSPKFVHVHPRALEVFARPARRTMLATVLGPLVNRFAALTPSKADLDLLLAMNQHRTERDFELEIVTQMGVTTVVPGPDERASRHLLPYFRAYRDEVYSGLVTDYIGLPLLNQIDRMIVDLNDRLRGAFEITLYPWRTP